MTKDAKSSGEDVVTEVEESTAPFAKRRSLWRFGWLKSDGQERRIFGIRVRWWVGFVATAVVVLVVLCAILTTVLRRKPRHREPLNIPWEGSNTSHWPVRDVLRTNFPDPNLFKLNDTWYAFATNNAAGVLHEGDNDMPLEGFGKANVQLATSTNFVNWTLANYTKDPLPKLGDWVANGTMRLGTENQEVRRANVWAPNVLQRPDGKFVLYYAATAGNATGNHCVGAAVSNRISGPYEPLPTPLACPTEVGGAIDPSSIIDSDGTIYVAYKIDGNNKGNGGSCGNTVPPLKNTPILLQKLEQDAVTPAGPPVTILDRTDEDGPLVEAPNLVRTHTGVYFLFFSSGCTRLPSYDVKYATSTNITGPYVRSAKKLLKTDDFGLTAPGSVSVVQDGSNWRMAFHARVMTEFGGVRAMFTANLTINGTDVSFDTKS